MDGGSKKCTSGIQIWSEIFYVNVKGEKVAIMLMDTQGLFDNHTEKKTNAVIFALSTLISSVQIFNLSKQIDASALEFLQFFTDYAMATPSQGHIGKPFQTLIFLIRDWQNGDETGYGTSGGNEHLQENLHAESSSKELSSVRKHLTSSFTDTKCFLLPHPGLSVFKTKLFEGRLKDIDEEFLEHTKVFVEELFKPENIVKKTINEKVVEATIILQYISDCSESISNGELPNPKTMSENVAEAQNYKAQKTCAESYCQAMEKRAGSEYVEKASLDKMDEEERFRCLRMFTKETKFGSAVSRDKHREYLKKMMQREYVRLSQRNECKKNEAKARIRKAVDNIKDEYEKAMDEVTKDTKFIEDEKLNASHVDCVSKARRAWANVKESNTLKDEYFAIWNGFIEKKIKRLRENNAEKKRIAEALKQEREARKHLEDIKSQHRKDLRKVTEQYLEESDLKEKDQNLRSKNRKELESELIKLGIKEESSLFKKKVLKLNESFEKDFTEAEQTNKENKNESDSKIRKVVDDIKEEYEKAMDEVTKGIKFIDDDTLEAEHEKSVSRAENVWSEVKEPSALKDKYFKVWNGFIGRKIKRLREDNAEKKKEAKAQQQKSEAVVFRLNIESQHKKDLRKVTEKYLNEINLKQKDQELRSTNRKELESQLIDLGIQRESSLFKEEVRKLNESFENDFAEAEQKNKENKETLLEVLKKERDTAYAGYDKTMKALLNEAYMSEENLKKQHDDTVSSFIGAMRSKVINNEDTKSIIDDHLQKAKEHFKEKYSTTKEWNAENKSVLRKIFEVAKVIFFPITAIVQGAIKLINMIRR